MTSKLTREQMLERARENVKALKMASRQHAFESAREEILADLQLTEYALARLEGVDSEPVAWTDEEELRDANESGSGYLFGIERDANKFADPRRQIMLYRHAQQPVVPPMQHWEELCREHPDMSIGDAIIRAAWWNHCRAAMLQAEPVTTANKLGNSPVIPDTWIPVSERMPENDVSVLTFDGMYKRVHHAMYGHWQCWEPEKITHWMPLPAAPQEVK